MKHVILIFLTATLLESVGATQSSAACNAAPKIYDLQADWSNIQNPNGPWSYREGESLLISNPVAWVGAAYDGCPFPCGGPNAPAIVQASGTALPAYGDRLQASDGYFDYFRDGDIVCVSGTGVNILWTAPVSGNTDISGSTWVADLNSGPFCAPEETPARIAGWTLTDNGAPLSQWRCD